MFGILKNIFGGKPKWPGKYNFRKVTRSLGPWQPYSGPGVISGTRLPKMLELPKQVRKFGDEPGQVPLSTALFPYWLRLDPVLAGFVVKKIQAGEMYAKTSLPREGKEPRTIAMPCQLLKFMQRRILWRLLEQIEVHDAAHGFINGKSIFSAAAPHTGKRVVVSMDIRDFFGTISFARVVGMFIAYGMKKDRAMVLAGLCCLEGCLPQGAPTSPMISNIICRKLDARLAGLAKKRGWSYTRYADDLILSGDEKLVGVLPFVAKIIEDEGFKVAEEKNRVMRSGGRQRVLGLNVNNKVSVPRKVRRIIRAMAFTQSQSMDPDSSLIDFLKGHLAFMKPAHLEYSEKIKKQLSAL